MFTQCFVSFLLNLEICGISHSYNISQSTSIDKFRLQPPLNNVCFNYLFTAITKQRRPNLLQHPISSIDCRKALSNYNLCCHYGDGLGNTGSRHTHPHKDVGNSSSCPDSRALPASRPALLATEIRQRANRRAWLVRWRKQTWPLLHRNFEH